MSAILDILGASVLVGMIMLTVMSVNINMSTQTYKSMSDFNIQTQTIQLARIMEFDLYKMGYNLAKPAVAIAESSRLKFYANLFDIPNGRDSVEYGLAGFVTSSPNPRDRMLYRYENTTRVLINFSATRFKLSYYTGKDSLLSAPVVGAWRDSIRSVRVLLTLESPEAFDNAYCGGYYEKLIYPRNLQ